MPTSSEENCLKAIWKLQSQNGEAVSTNAIAAEVNIRPASVTDMLKKLAAKKLIRHQPYRGVTLTAKGNHLATGIVRRHRLWEYFLTEKLKFRWDEVHELAEQLEHIRFDSLTDRLDKYLGFPKKDPHGDPIPGKDGTMPYPKQTALSELPEKSKMIFTGVGDHSTSFLRFLDQHFMRLGDSITIKKINTYDGSMQVLVNGKKTATISKKVASSILVNKP